RGAARVRYAPLGLEGISYMEEHFDYGSQEDPKLSVARYEEMIRNKDQYFFDSQAFEGIIDYYIDKNDPVKALQVVDYAVSQHPFAAIFYIKQAQLYAVTNQLSSALQALEKAESLEPSEGEIYFIKGGILGNLEHYDEAFANL